MPWRILSCATGTYQNVDVISNKLQNKIQEVIHIFQTHMIHVERTVITSPINIVFATFSTTKRSPEWDLGKSGFAQKANERR